LARLCCYVQYKYNFGSYLGKEGYGDHVISPVATAFEFCRSLSTVLLSPEVVTLNYLV
jgi:hypothetical protein